MTFKEKRKLLECMSSGPWTTSPSSNDCALVHMGLLTTKAGTFPWTQNMPKGNADGVVALVNAAREEVEFIELLLRAADKLDFLPGAHQDLSDGLRYEAQKLMDNER